MLKIVSYQTFFFLLAKMYVQEVDPCDDLTDDDIQMLIQNASGLRNVLFAPEVSLMIMSLGVFIVHFPLSRVLGYVCDWIIRSYLFGISGSL